MAHMLHWWSPLKERSLIRMTQPPALTLGQREQSHQRRVDSQQKGRSLYSLTIQSCPGGIARPHSVLCHLHPQEGGHLSLGALPFTRDIRHCPHDRRADGSMIMNLPFFGAYLLERLKVLLHRARQTIPRAVGRSSLGTMPRCSVISCHRGTSQKTNLGFLHDVLMLAAMPMAGYPAT